ncbi:MAG TPA: glycosyltransferase [Polyangiaceae bacterium]|nr:glycosyltransferase [Polyangiaceae bacterium]
MSRPLRVFHLIKSLGRGGAEMLLADGPRLSDPARIVYGFGYFLPHKDALVPELKRQFGHVVCFPATNAGAMFAQTARVAAHLRHWRADLVHCHLPLAGAVGRLAGLAARVPVVYTEHNAIERYHTATRLAARATWRLQRRVIAVSSDVAASISRAFGGAVPVQVVLNGVSLDRFVRGDFDGDRDRVRRELGIAPEHVVIGSVAVFRKQKRLDLWLEVARRVLDETPHARFLLVGDGPERQLVERRVSELGLSGRVLLPGLQTDVRPYLAAMDVYLMTSDFEGVPLALLEAMAMQLTPVVTDAGGMPEMIQSGTNGIVLPRGDVASLAREVQALLAGGADRRHGYGEAARQRVRDRFSTRRMMSEIEQIYSDAVAS